MYGVVLIFVLVVTGGAIAFIGDKLGSKVGKKKMSVFGLRPKHTSILVTIVTGVLITTTTLGVMSIMSENVRTALFGMEQLNQNMAQARNDLAEASAQLAMAKAEQDQIKDELEQTRVELKGLETQKGQLEARSQELQSANARLEASNSELTATNQKLSQRSDKLTRINNILEEGNERLNKNNEELYQINRELTTGIQIMREGSITFQAGETLASGVIKGKSSLDDVHENIGRMLAVARYNVTRKLGTDADEKERDVWIYQPEFDEAAKYISEHEGNYVLRIVAAGNFIQGESVAATLQLYENHTVYKNGALILEKKISYDPKSEAQLEAAITNFLSDINRKAKSDGMIADSVNGSIGVIDAEQIYDMLAQLRNSSGNAIISAFAEGATDIIGPLRIKLKLVNGLQP